MLLKIDANLDQPYDKAFNDFLHSCSLIDFIKRRHGEPGPTHNGGNRLNLIAGSAFLLDYIMAIGSLHEDGSVPSNYSGLFLDLSTEIFHADTDPIAPANRGFISQ